MIELFSGTPGSGKSLHTAKDIRDRLRSKKAVIIGNFYVNTKAIKKCRGRYIYVSNDRLTPERLLLFARRYASHLGRRLKEGELLLIIDEAQLIFNSREWQNIGRQGWLSFFSQHRHYGYDVYLVAQFDRMLDRQVRSLIEYETVHRKVSRAGYIGFFVGLLMRGNLYVAVKRWYPIKEKVDSSFFLGSKKVFLVYDSYNHFGSPGVGAERGQRGPVRNTHQEEKNGKGEHNGFAGLDSLRIGTRTCKAAPASGDVLPGSLSDVVSDEAADDTGTELRSDRVYI